jgi:hypothetical protein
LIALIKFKREIIKMGKKLNEFIDIDIDKISENSKKLNDN